MDIEILGFILFIFSPVILLLILYGICYLLYGICWLIDTVLDLLPHRKKERGKREKERETYEEKREKAREILEESYKKHKETYKKYDSVVNYGRYHSLDERYYSDVMLDSIINGEYEENFEEEIRVNLKEKIVFINGENYKFSDIVDVKTKTEIGLEECFGKYFDREVYYLIININSFSTPILKIYFDNQEDECYEAEAIIKNIIRSNVGSIVAV